LPGNKQDERGRKAVKQHAALKKLKKKISSKQKNEIPLLLDD
jgi:hypothetical protein